jgi:hypothetical protein
MLPGIIARKAVQAQGPEAGQIGLVFDLEAK